MGVIVRVGYDQGFDWNLTSSLKFGFGCFDHTSSVKLLIHLM